MNAAQSPAASACTLLPALSTDAAELALLHAACFDLRTGMPSGPPAKTPVRTHQVVIADGVVHVVESVPASGAATGVRPGVQAST